MTGMRAVSSAVSSTVFFAASAFFGRGTTFAGGFFSAGGSGSFSSGSARRRAAAVLGQNALERELRVLVHAAGRVFQQQLGVGERFFKFKVFGSISFLLYRHCPRRWRTAS